MLSLGELLDLEGGKDSKGELESHGILVIVFWAGLSWATKGSVKTTVDSENK